MWKRYLSIKASFLKRKSIPSKTKSCLKRSFLSVFCDSLIKVFTVFLWYIHNSVKRFSIGKRGCYATALKENFTSNPFFEERVTADRRAFEKRKAQKYNLWLLLCRFSLLDLFGNTPLLKCSGGIQPVRTGSVEPVANLLFSSVNRLLK